MIFFSSTSLHTMPEYLVRLVQVHESFRKAELQALADVAGVGIEFVKYNQDVGKKLSLPYVSYSCIRPAAAMPFRSY